MSNTPIIHPFDYIGLSFENVEGIYIHKNAFERIFLTDYNESTTFDREDEELIQRTAKRVNHVSLLMNKGKLFDSENLLLKNMHRESTDAIKDFEKHIYSYYDIVSISFFDSQSNTETEYYVDWNEKDDNQNLNMTVEDHDDDIMVRIKA